MRGRERRREKQRGEAKKDESQRKKEKKRREKSILTSGQCVGPQLYPKLSFFKGELHPKIATKHKSEMS